MKDLIILLDNGTELTTTFDGAAAMLENGTNIKRLIYSKDLTDQTEWFFKVLTYKKEWSLSILKAYFYCFELKQATEYDLYELYYGRFDSIEDFGRHLAIDDDGMSIPYDLMPFVDFAAYGQHELDRFFICYDGYYFRFLL